MRSLLLMAAAVGAFAACSSKEPKSDSAAPDSTAADTGPVWNALMWNPQQRPTIDRGTGVIGFANRKDAPVPRIDTLIFRAEPNDSAAVVGYFMVRTDTSASAPWHWGVKAPELDKPNLLEYEDGVAGVPTDSATANGRWVRGLLGTDKNVQMLTGWADARPRTLTKRQWATYLRRMPIFVLDTTTGASATTPEGTTHPLPPDDYQLHALTEARGRWLQVRVVSPPDRCTSDKSPRTTTTEWVEYLDARGRPKFWYYLKGCQ